ncbi:MAG: type 4a pilus biogenesis protein PilO [Candidatus Omnitrophota bacterium]
MISLTVRERYLFLVYLGIILIIGLYFGLFRFAVPAHFNINEKIVQNENILIKIYAILNKKEIVEKQYHAFLNKFKQIDKGKIGSTEILQDIKGQAQEAGLNVINVKPLLEKDEDLYRRFNFKLETEGELKNFGKFLYKLDDSSYLFTIKYAQINAQEQDQPLKFQFLLSVAIPKG